VAAQAAANIPLFAINRLGQDLVAREWLGVAQAAVARLGRETLATAMLASSEGMVALANHDYARALDLVDQRFVIMRRLLGPDDPLTIDSEATKGDWQAAAGRLDEALQTDIAAREHFERVLGREHPRVAMVWNNQGEVLDLLGRHAEAEAAYEQAVQLFRRSGTGADLLAWSLTGLGRARLGKQRPSTAVAPLEEALAIRVEKHASTAQLGETRFALARALWSHPQDRQRALALAASARDDYRDDKDRRDEVETWLARARAESSRDRKTPADRLREKGT
jgi:tetratricopeptide (TPR) repeat protein